MVVGIVTCGCWSNFCAPRQSNTNGIWISSRCAGAHVLNRELEEILNRAWSGAVVVGMWIAFDEQMVKCTARVAHFLIRFNKSKPIKHGKPVMFSPLLIPL